jgi:hypothetical protein
LYDNVEKVSKNIGNKMEDGGNQLRKWNELRCAEWRLLQVAHGSNEPQPDKPYN